MADKTSASPAGKAPGSLSKKEAVRRALQDLGREAKPMQIREHVKKRYRIDMGLDHISTVKGEILRETGQAKSAATPKAATPPAKHPAVRKAEPGKAGMPPGKRSQAISLKDIETVKDLVERVGATSLKRLIDVMAR